MGKQKGSAAILDLLRAAYELASENYDPDPDADDECPTDQMLWRMGRIVQYLGQAIERIEKGETSNGQG